MTNTPAGLNLLRRFPFYPVLIGIYPVLFLWLVNYSQIRPIFIVRSLLIALGITAVVCLLSLALFRNLSKAGAMAGLVLALFFSYGHLYDLVNFKVFFGFIYGRHRVLLLLCGLLFCVGFFFILRVKSNLGTLTLNLVSGSLVLMTLAQLGYMDLKDMRLAVQQQAAAAKALPVSLPNTVKTGSPDVYYFLLDSYDRQDKMSYDVHLDNSAFVTELESMGFVFPDCTQSNYNNTIFTMSATLNMNYLDQLGYSYAGIAGLDQNSYTSLLQPLTKDSLVMRIFKGIGYKFVTLKVSYPFIDFPDADIVYDYWRTIQPIQGVEAYNFQDIFLRTTLFRPLIDATVASPEKFYKFSPALLAFLNSSMFRSQFSPKNPLSYQVYLQNQFQLDQLESVAQIPGKKFVYAHVMVTHPPYVFTPAGDPTMLWSTTPQGYSDQVSYLDRRLLVIIKNILAQSKTPPVIVLQADHAHGWNRQGKDEFKILNAYYLPQGGSAKVNKSITPVNTFRLIFSTYFQQNLPMLPDQSILIQADIPGGSQVVPDSCIH